MSPKPTKCIPVAEARKMEENYVEVIEKLLKKEIKKGNESGDTREFWWSISEIEEYIAYIRENVKGDTSKLGLRFYLGKYNKNKVSGDTTMFISATQPKVTKEDSADPGDQENIYSVEPMNESGGGFPPKVY